MFSLKVISVYLVSTIGLLIHFLDASIKTKSCPSDLFLLIVYMFIAGTLNEFD
jgi:hypothetical protein